MQSFTFRTAFGWSAIAMRGNVVVATTFAHRRADEARHALLRLAPTAKVSSGGSPTLVERLQAYLAGTPIDFSDVVVDLDDVTPFRRRVLQECRRVGYGQTLTYAALAEKAGNARAARAVGSCMASNRLPLVVPCHRIVPADGRLGGFSAPGGAATKQRLLEMEAALCPVGPLFAN